MEAGIQCGKNLFKKTHRRSLQESQQQVCSASAVAVDVSVSDAEDRSAGDVGGPAIRS